MNFINATTLVRYKDIILGFILLLLGTAQVLLADDAAKDVVLEKDGQKLSVTIQQLEHKYVALLRPRLPPDAAGVKWSCKYHPSSGLHLISSTDGSNLAGEQSITTDTQPIKLSIDDPDVKSASIFLQCIKLPSNAQRNVTININLEPEKPLNQKTIRLGDRSPVDLDLSFDRNEYRASITFEAPDSLMDSFPIACSYSREWLWHVMKEDKDVSGYFNIEHKYTSVDFIVTPNTALSKTLTASLTCQKTTNQPIDVPEINLKISGGPYNSSILDKLCYCHYCHHLFHYSSLA